MSSPVPPGMHLYHSSRCVAFRRTSEKFGGLSNMAGGFPLHMNGIRIRTTEALYQACRFPESPEIQEMIIGQASPMTAKMKAKPFVSLTRADWDRIRIDVMRWCLRVKLIQNWDSFVELLRATGDQPIVENSRRDSFWGAIPDDEGNLVGRNVLGRLLMELRRQVVGSDLFRFQTVVPPEVPNFYLIGSPIGQVSQLDVPIASAARNPSTSEQLRLEESLRTLFLPR